MYEDAIHCYDEALKIDPRSELALKNKGNALDAKGDYKGALLCFKEASKINPNSQIYRDKIRLELEKLGQAYVSETVPGPDPRNPYNDPTLPYYNPNLDKKNNESNQDVQKPPILSNNVSRVITETRSHDKYDRAIEEGRIQKTGRFAIVVGINEYQENDKIPTLAGAENDAQELRKILTTNNNFEVLDNHFLVGERATRTAILRAINDVVRADANSELILFYFSGHGMVDENEEGYIVPYDMHVEDPFVSGIRMEDLKYVIERASNKTNVAIILDCCYEGIVTKGTKAIPSGIKKHLESVYNEKVRKLDEPGARYILASSEADATSREINDCVHPYNPNPHSHGAFSFHLIEGLAGAAANEIGIITFRSLKDHIGKKMIEEGKQLPIFTQTETGAFGEIQLGVRQNVFREYVSKLIDETRKLIAKEEESSPVDIRKLNDAVKILSDLSKKDPNNSELPKLKLETNQRFEEHRDALLEWLNYNEWDAGREIDKISRGLYNRFHKIAYELSYEGYQKLKEEDKRYILCLSYESEDRTHYKSPQDERLQRLVRTLEAIKRRYELEPLK